MGMSNPNAGRIIPCARRVLPDHFRGTRRIDRARLGVLRKKVEQSLMMVLGYAALA